MSSKHSESKESHLRIVLLGRTGAGKSASGNTILGRTSFTVDSSSASVTTKCQEETREFNGQTLTIVDTPGLFHTSKDRKELMNEILDSTLSIQPGPHVFLLVMKLGLYTKNDRKALEAFQKVFTEAKPYTIVLFTHRGECEVKEFIEKNKSLEDFISQSCVEYQVFNNEDKSDGQVTSLLQKINNVVQENGGKCYSNKMFEAAVEAFNMAMQCPDVKSAMQPKEEGKAQLKIWMAKGFAALEEHDPGLFKSVNNFLKYVQDVAYKCMPAESRLEH